MNILVTGGAGFQGSHICKALIEKGHRVRVLNTPSIDAHQNLLSFPDGVDVEVVWGSVCDQTLVERSVEGMDLVVHLAAEINVDKSLSNPKIFIDTNIMGTINILKEVTDNEIRMVYASTCEVYGAAVYKPMDEKHPLNPHSPYAASKSGADRLCYSYHRSFGTDVTIVRPFNIYGPNQKSKRFGALIPILISRILNGKPPLIFGTGEQTRDYMYVSDLADAYMLVIGNENLSGEVINFGSGKETSIKYIAEKLVEIIDPSIVPQHMEPRSGEVSSFCADISKARSLGFSPEVDIDEGLVLTVENQVPFSDD